MNIEKDKRIVKWFKIVSLVTFLLFLANLASAFLNDERGTGLLWVFVFSVLQLAFGITSCVLALKLTSGNPFRNFFTTVGFVLFGLSGGLILVIKFMVELVSALGGAWGRPLRLRGKVVHPNLANGSDWTRGDKPDASALTPATAQALEALWLHDAQKEHASVPAFSRLSWQLVAIGAPADLIEAVHQAALEEIEHTRLCFALAEGYGRRSHTVCAMPELLRHDFGITGDAYVHLARESLLDGGLLEDYNADVAHACAQVCLEPVTKRVLEQIAREERSHAALSWRVVSFCLERGGEPVRVAMMREMGAIAQVARPTAATTENQILVRAADPKQLLDHGRLPDSQWAEIWQSSVVRAEKRLRALLTRQAAQSNLQALAV